jgi:hypothetical protein
LSDAAATAAAAATNGSSRCKSKLVIIEVKIVTKYYDQH